MNVIETEIPGIKIVEPQVFGDSRGWFVEQYNAERYKAAGIDADFVQDNESFRQGEWCADSTGRLPGIRKRSLCG